MSENGSRRVVEFDIDRYVRNSKKVDLTQIDWEDIPNHPLSDGDVMCLHYMMDIETHTVIYLRDLLATRASHDPHVTAFLSCWVYEELWHGEAFSDFLRAVRPRGPGRAAAARRLAPPALPPGAHGAGCASGWASATSCSSCPRCSARS